MNDLISPKYIFKAAAVLLSLYVLSWIGYTFPLAGGVLFWVILALVCVATLRNPSWGTFAVLAELMIGAKGYLLSFPVFGFVVSLRLGLFLLVMAIWFIRAIKHKEVRFARSPFFIPYAALTISIALGVVLAFVRGNALPLIFYDVNAYLYFAFAFVLFDTFTAPEAKKRLINIFVAGGLAVALFSLFVSIEFSLFHQDSRPDLSEAISYEQSIEGELEGSGKISHSTNAKTELTSLSLTRDFSNQKAPLYRWTQDTGLAEISYLTGPFFRAFSTAQLYALLVALFAMTMVLKQKRILFDRSTLTLLGVALLTLVAVALGLSRSLWIGGVAGALLMLVLIPRRRMVKIVVSGVVLASASFLILSFVAPSVTDLFTSRVDSILHPSTESASSNRMNLLGPIVTQIQKHPFFGSGFGTTVEYQSVSNEKLGTLRVFAFEWGYLDIATKIGFIGLAVYMWLLAKIVRESMRRTKRFETEVKSSGLKVFIPRPLADVPIASLLVGLCALVVIHITTPYLNHPLGIGFILMVIWIVDTTSAHYSATNQP